MVLLQTWSAAYLVSGKLGQRVDRLDFLADRYQVRHKVDFRLLYQDTSHKVASRVNAIRLQATA